MPCHIIATSSLIVGKTVFLHVLLVLRLQARLPTIYQSRDSYLYYFNEDGVFVTILAPGLIATRFQSHFHPSTWCLIDSNQSVGGVPVFIQDLNLFIVQASSPSPHSFEWVDKATSLVLRYFLKSWTLSELFVGYVTCTLISESFVIPLSRMLQRTVYTEAQIEYFSNRYGTSARSVYTNASSPLDYEKTLLRKLGTITYEKLDNLFRQSATLDLSGPVSHQLVLISPGATRKDFEASFPTRYLYEKLRDSLSDHKLEAVARLYDMYVRVPNTRGTAGPLLEDAVNDVFPRGGEWNLVSMTKSNRTGTKFIHWKAPTGATTPRYLHFGHMGHCIAICTQPNPVGTVYEPLPLISFLPGAQLSLKDGFYCPTSRCQETFDAFVYESGSKLATVFQVTTAQTHSVKEGGVEWLQGLGVEKFRYIAVSPPNTPLDLPFPNRWNGPSGPSIPEKYLLTVKSLPKK